MYYYNIGINTDINLPILGFIHINTSCLKYSSNEFGLVLGAIYMAFKQFPEQLN